MTTECNQLSSIVNVKILYDIHSNDNHYPKNCDKKGATK